jgi:exosortase/archaeosortase family protein
MFAASVVAGLFVAAPFAECLKRAIRHPRLAIIAVIAASAAANYYLLSEVMWKQMCNWTLNGIYTLLSIFHMNIHAYPGASNEARLILLRSPYFGINIWADCSGLEGIFLFNFMLSIVFLMDWEIFKRRSILLLYGFGIMYMFILNILRISLFFALGYWAYRPDAPEWVQHLQGAPIYLFHSYIGWLIYLVAFASFAAQMYRPDAHSQLPVKKS